MPVTQADIDRIEAAVARPERTIELSDGRRISLNNMSEKLAALRYLKRELNGTGSRTRQYRMAKVKGY